MVSVDEEGQVYVGDSAVERGLLCPESAAGVFKRDMGSQKKYSLLHKTFTAEELFPSPFTINSLSPGRISSVVISLVSFICEIGT